MAIAQSSIIALSLLYTNKPPSASDLQYWASPAAANVTWEQAVTAFATSAPAKAVYPYLAAPGIANAGQYVAQVFANAYGIAAADIPAAELTYWTNWLTLSPNNYLDFPVVLNQYSPAARQAALQNRADVALDFSQKMLAAGSVSFTETQYGNGWAIVNTVTADPATVTTAKAANTTFVANGGGQTGTTFTFTTAIDSFQGGATNDTFVGDNGGAFTVQAADQVNGGGGIDTFKYYAPTTALPSLVDVENIQLLGATFVVNNIDFSPLSGKGAQSVTFVGSAPNGVNVLGLSGLTFGVDNVAGIPNIAGDFGTAAAATFAINNSQLGNVAITGTGTTLKALTVNAEGKGDSIAGLTTTSVDTLNIAGKGGLTVGAVLNNNIKTIDASKNSGGVNLIPGFSDLTFTGGTGKDTLSFTAGWFNTKDVLDGGVGQDALRLGDVAINPLAGALNAVKNFETLSFTGAGATVDVGAITAFTDYRLEGAGNFAVTNASSTNTFTIAVNNVGNATSIANKIGQSTANLTIEGTKFDAGTLSFTGLTTLNLASTKGSATATDANTVSFNAGSPVDNLTILVTGDQNLTINSPFVTKTGVTVDATKFTASLTATGTNKADILTGSAQKDSLTGNGGADALTGGTGADTFILNQAFAGNTVNVTDFTVAQNDVFGLSNAAYAGAPAVGATLVLSAVSGAANAATTILVDTQANINAASIANIRFAYGSDTKTLWYDADGNFTAGSVAIATSTLAFTPTASSFSIVA